MSATGRFPRDYPLFLRIAGLAVWLAAGLPVLTSWTRLHAAGTALLGIPEARLDAVRPGLALYRGAVRVSAPLAEVHASAGPVGYSGFTPSTGRHGVILAG